MDFTSQLQYLFLIVSGITSSLFITSAVYYQYFKAKPCSLTPEQLKKRDLCIVFLALGSVGLFTLGWISFGIFNTRKLDRSNAVIHEQYVWPAEEYQEKIQKVNQSKNLSYFWL